MTTTKSRTAKKTTTAATKKTAAPVRKPAAKKSASSPVGKKRVVRVKKQAHEFNAYVPDISVHEKYVGRKVQGGIWDIVLAKIASRDGLNILLMGETGSGKTLFGEAVASYWRRPYYSLPCDVSIDPSALFGRMQPTDKVGVFEWQDGPVTEIVRGPCGLGDKCEDPECWAGILNISEINFMPAKIAASLYPLLDGRRYIPLLGHKGEVVRAHKGLVVIADMNPNYRGTVELNAAFYNRFDFKIPWNYDPEVEDKLVHFPTVRELAGKLREMMGTEIKTPVSTNMLMEFERFSMDPELGVAFASANFVAAFKQDERSSVARLFELDEDNIEKDKRHYERTLRRRTSASPVVEDDSELEEVEVEYEEEDD